MTQTSDKQNYGLHPLWQLLRKEYGMETALQSFGPYRGASILPRIIDACTVEVSMPLVPLNTNYVGTHFGGSLYSMCDPFYMFILIENLGPGYLVWDKSARIDFRRPGTGTVTARFHIPPEEIEEIAGIVDQEGKTTRNFQVDIRDEKNQVVATVFKELYIRRQ